MGAEICLPVDSRLLFILLSAEPVIAALDAFGDLVTYKSAVSVVYKQDS